MDNKGNGKDKLSMDMAYEDVLDRLKEERIIHRLSQEDLSRQLKITQGHYSKAEHAIKRFTYYEVKSLADSELDLYYIYTGRRIVHRHGEILKNCSYRELLCYLHVLLSLACCRYGEQRRESEAKRFRQLSRLKYITGAEDGQESIFMLVRKYERQTQFEMADCLGIDIKRYRGVEKGTCLPDSELLFKLYSLFDISPAHVLKDRRGISCEVEYYLNKVDPAANGAIYRYFRLMRELYVSRRVKKDVPQGVQDTQGTSNVQGMPDTQGTSNVQGMPDTQGMQDAQSMSNTQGTSNVQGMPDTQGTPNVQGMQDTQGTQDAQSMSNTQGTPDAQSSQNMRQEP